MLTYIECKVGKYVDIKKSAATIWVAAMICNQRLSLSPRAITWTV
jgi:hypothetical protein